jgi:hypothetical protein
MHHIQRYLVNIRAKEKIQEVSEMQYSARVEIHNNQYDLLHSAMALEGFKRILTAEGTGVQYHMPIGHYWIETTNDRCAVLAAARRAALTVDARAEIVVSGDGRIVFSGCPKVEQPRPLARLLAPAAGMGSGASAYKPGALARALAEYATQHRPLSGR